MMGTMAVRAPERYMKREKCRTLNQKERSKVFDMYVYSKYSVDYIVRYLNINKPIVEKHLFSTGNNKNFSKPQVVGIIGFEKQTAYWNTEHDILESLDPKYDADTLTGWEKKQLSNSIKSEFKLQLL